MIACSASISFFLVENAWEARGHKDGTNGLRQDKVSFEARKLWGRQKAQVTLEPVGCNSASANTAALLAMKLIHRLLYGWCLGDTGLTEPQVLMQVMGKAIEAEELGRIVTFGVTPTHPQTGYEYIERGQPF